ncbi:aspartyl protease family protein [Aquimarina spongiae]|uniref:Aspartyl protease n=1 Tax=Aquimarina spongiae TaxID=570521 RepID=A0A1M6E229_9FLAO|nr:aspartyl protease family protein [Aquimarina spongiae]SHI79459.1 Aspartyl protease [Aquimarina spongiae]
MNRFFLIIILCIGSSLQAQVATIPFEKKELVFIKVKVNQHQEPLHFVFDTGASTAVLDSEVAKRLGIQSNYSQNTRGANGSEVYQIATGQSITIENIKFQNVNLVLVDLKELAQRTGTRLEGIIGYDVLKKFVTQMDFETHTIKLYTSSKEIPDRNTYQELPLQFKRGPIPQIEVDFVLKDGSTESGSFLFDSGANLTVAFNTPFAKKNNIKSRTGKTITAKARGLTKTSMFTIGAAQKLSIANNDFLDLPIDISETKTGVSGSSAYDGILGAKIINRFNMILDYQDKIWYFKPNVTFKKPFYFPMSGISIKLVGDQILVGHVIENSEAYRLGIREGDELLAINEYTGKDLSVWRNHLRKDQEKVTLKVKKERSEEVEQVTILLKRLL